MTRNPMLAKIHIARKDLGLSEDSYRDILYRITGQRSASGLSNALLTNTLDEFKRLGFKTPLKERSRAVSRPLANAPHATKIRALWLSLYHLGIIVDPSEAALAKFVQRQTKIAALQWLKPSQSDKVIEALKKWATREAGVDWSTKPRSFVWPDGTRTTEQVDVPRERVIEAQWRRIYALGAVRIGTMAGRDAWIRVAIKSPCEIGLANLTDAQADRVISQMGTTLRAAIAKATARPDHLCHG